MPEHRINKQRRRNLPWSVEEVKALQKGVAMLGRKWTRIQEQNTILHTRTGTDLKARNRQ